MKITCNYDSLVSVLSSIAVVVEDSMNSEDMKNVIIRAYKDNGVVELIGVNQLITYRVELPIGCYSVDISEEEYKDNGVAEIQVKSKELVSFLSSFKSIRRTRVSDIELETVKNKVVVTVNEADIDTGKAYKSHWRLDNIPIKVNMLPSINLEVPTSDLIPIDVSAILLYTSSLLPIMDNGANLYSKLVFGQDNVVAFNTTFTTLMKNFLSGVFENFCLSYRALSFMKSVINSDTSVEVAKMQDRICFRIDNSVAFIRYETKLPNYEIYQRMIDKSHAFVLDRQYLKDVLKRLSLVNESITFSIDMDTETIEVKNSKFNQELPILQSKAMSELGKVSFKILPDVISKAIIGDDNAFSQLVYIYLAPQENGGYTIIFADDSGSWSSISRIR